MTLKSLQSYGKAFQLKVLGSLLTDKGFLLNVRDVLYDDYFDADLIFMLYRDYVYTKNEEWKNVAEVRLVKHRNGPTKDILLSFREELTRFGDLAPEVMNSYAQDRTAD